MSRTALAIGILLFLLPNNSGAVTIETHASASTGGQIVHGGEAGSSGSASANIHTVINANDNGGTVKVEIETEHDGVFSKETRVEEIPKGGEVSLHIATSSGARSTSTVHVRLEHQGNDSASSTRATSTEIKNRVSRFSNFFRHLFSFFGWF